MNDSLSMSSKAKRCSTCENRGGPDALTPCPTCNRYGPMLRRIVVTVLVLPDDEDNMPAIPAIEAAITDHVLNPGESIESIAEVDPVAL